ncbi:MAG: crossover junction endodeoxyribonuclease RuvC, partial [Methylobacteriaceae bacterium]|nr:crossover junction endodeoxyribonuclease RuvC [Methylobacteriaceae bacterium]
MPAPPIRIIGIDPGLRNMGWGIIDAAGTRLSFVACGSVASDERQTPAERLCALHGGLSRVVQAHGPH